MLWTIAVILIILWLLGLVRCDCYEGIFGMGDKQSLSHIPLPSPISNATGKLSNISPTDSALPVESTSFVITFRQAAGAPSGIITSVSCHTCLPRGKSPY